MYRMTRSSIVAVLLAAGLLAATTSAHAVTQTDRAEQFVVSGQDLIEATSQRMSVESVVADLTAGMTVDTEAEGQSMLSLAQPVQGGQVVDQPSVDDLSLSLSVDPTESGLDLRTQMLAMAANASATSALVAYFPLDGPAGTNTMVIDDIIDDPSHPVTDWTGNYKSAS